MKAMLVTLTVTLGALVTLTAAAQAQNGGRDQYGNRGVGDRAEEDAVMASGTFSVVVTDESQEGTAQAAEPPSGGSAPPEATPPEDATSEAADESGSAERPDITELPDTGGASSLALGVLLVAGGLLVGGRALFR